MIELIALILFLFPLAYSPGPGNLFFAALAARAGFGSIRPAMIGYHFATLVVTILVGFGLLKALYSMPQLAQLLGVIGSLYVLYLAVKFFMAPTKLSTLENMSKNASFTDEVMLLLLNPKAYLIMVLMFTQFAPEQFAPNAPTVGVVLIAILFTANNLVAFLIWAFAGDQLIKRFRKPENQTMINRIFGSMLGAVGIWMLAENLKVGAGL